MGDSDSDTDDKDQFRTRIQALRNCAIEINREAELQRKSLERNEGAFQETISRITKSIEGLSTLKNNKFSLSFYIVLTTLVLCTLFYFLLLR